MQCGERSVIWFKEDLRSSRTELHVMRWRNKERAAQDESSNSTCNPPYLCLPLCRYTNRVRQGCGKAQMQPAS